jgi:hypothetical protein
LESGQVAIKLFQMLLQIVCLSQSVTIKTQTLYYEYKQNVILQITRNDQNF